ncbi:biotin--[acetyl-CoA-carboxylase] ligase [Microbacterium sp. ZW T5_45]|uniref:biotin--[acetyl-CoA-carboxylase] ligase n=1 Tax=Microbacterium sp. ZW T5_45 TaxID=3378080 RepID=UPI0038528035
MELPLTRTVSPHVDVRERTGSTNADLRALAGDLPHLAIVLTDDQTAGRGRLDRAWIAPAGASLAISVLLRDLPVPVDARGWIPLAAGVAMADAVAEQLPDRTVAVKWPNDVLADGRKICGILAEATEDAVVVGSGVNTAMTADQLPVPTATSFAVLGVEVDSDRLIAGYVGRLAELITALAAAGDATASGLHAQATARCGTLGLDVTVSLPGERELAGTAIALDAEGRLIVVSDGVEHAISAGDVVHVRPV